MSGKMNSRPTRSRLSDVLAMNSGVFLAVAVVSGVINLLMLTWAILMIRIYEPGLYASLINKSYDLKGKQALTADKLDAADTTTVRLVKKVEAYFRTVPAGAGDHFNHYSPAEWLMLNPGFLNPETDSVPETLEPAEALFKALNALLPA